MTVEFRFDSAAHEYTELSTGEIRPHITGMLERTGWIDDTWYTEESSSRGRAVHRLTAEYDLGALELDDCVSRYRGYLLSHVTVVGLARPQWMTVEEAFYHPRFRYGGRPDRTCIAYGLRAVWEVKSGEVAKSHAIQTALQAILAAESLGLPAEAVARFCEYVKDNGRYFLDQHKERTDFVEAYRIIRETCR